MGAAAISTLIRREHVEQERASRLSSRTSERIVYIRTKRGLRYSHEAVEAVIDCMPSYSIRVLRLGGDEQPFWEDGLALHYTGTIHPARLAEELKPALALMESWYIHDGDRIGVGPLLEWSPGFRQPFAQIYIAFHHNDRDPDGTAELIRGALGCESRPAFHFRDGRVLFAFTDQPARMLLRRCERKAHLVRHLSARDRHGEAEQLPLDVSVDPWVEHDREYYLIDPAEDIEAVFGVADG